MINDSNVLSVPRVVFVASLMLVAACQGSILPAPGNVEVSVAFQDGHLEVLDAVDVGLLPNPPANGDAVLYTFQPYDGTSAVSGFIADTRVLRSEFDRAGQPDPQTLVSNMGIFTVRIPAVRGRLELTGADGQRMGGVDFDPDAPLTRRQGLMVDSDVLGPPTKILDNGPSSAKVDILFLPEGYTEDEMDKFHAHVQSIVEQMETHSGYREHWDGFNFWRQDVRSRVSGTGNYGRPADTAFETAAGVSGLDRCVFFTNPAGIGAARRLGIEANADATVVLVNSVDHGGCAGNKVVVSARPRWVADVVSHELGHGLFGLRDEYDTPRPNAQCSAGPNVATSARLESLPWADMVTTSELPTSPMASFGTVGAFEGAGYCARGRFRPTHNCMMRSLGAGMCPVCKREVARTMATLAPDAGPDEGTRVISVTNRTGADLWVRCDGTARSTCSDWTFFWDGETKELNTPDGRIVLDNSELAAPVVFESARVTVTSDAVEVYANVADPLSPPSSTTDDTTNGPALTAPTGLSPNGVVLSSTNVELVWQDSDAAAVYRVLLEVEEGGSWSSYDDRGTMEASAQVTLPNTSARYRWRVSACDADRCLTSDYASFSTDFPTPDVDVPTNSASAIPSSPATLQPAHEAEVTGSTVTLSWDAPAQASTYNVTLRVHDSATNAWVEQGEESGLSEAHVQVGLPVAGTWYAWSVQACNDRGCSNWTEFSLLYRNP